MFRYAKRKLFWGIFRHLLSDRMYARVRYKMEHGYWPDIDNPTRLTEKIQWLKLYDRSPIRAKVADRMYVRAYISEKAGGDYLVPVYGIYDQITKKEWDELPDEFVLKANHGCGFVKLITDKKAENPEEIRKLTEKWLKTDYSGLGREWVYKDLPRKIIAEKFLKSESGGIPYDYKFTCIHGEVVFAQIDIDRFQNQHRNLYNKKFERLDVQLLYPPTRHEIAKPENWEKAVKLAEKLAEPFNFIRVDLYLADSQIYVGELTNFPGSGFIGFNPDEFDKKMGEKLNLKKEM